MKIKPEKGGQIMSKLIHVPFQSTNENMAVSNLRKLSPADRPIDPFAITQKLGIHLLEADFKKEMIAGILHKKEDRFLMYMKKKSSGFEKRWTVAHLLGHFTLHMDQNENKNFVDSCGIWNHDLQDYQVKEWIREDEANRFAMDLLMERKTLVSAWDDCHSPELISAQFQVPTSMVLMRLNESGYL